MAIKELTYRNCIVWINNNLAVRGRKFIGRKGVSDIIGFHGKTGVSVWCEVKTKNDRLSADQIAFMNEAKDAGCIVLLAVDEDGFKIKQYEKM